MTSLQTKIIDLMTAHPTLSSAGIHFRSRDKYWHDPEYLKNCRDEMLSERFLNEVSLCEAFIGRHGIQHGVTSYSLKHDVEDEHKNTYISNGAFIVAAINSGFAPVLNESPNPTFRGKPIAGKGIQMTPSDLQTADTISIPSGNTPDLVYSLSAGIPERWRGEVRNWLDFLPKQFRGRLLSGLETVTEIGRRNGEDETMIVSRMLDPLRAIHDDLWRDSSAWFCIRDFIACAEKIVGDGSKK